MGQHQKKPTANPQTERPVRSPALQQRPVRENAGVWVGAGVLFCLFAAYLFGGSEPAGALAAMGAALLLVLSGQARARVRERITPLTAAVTIFFLLSGVASIYSDFGWLSVKEFSKVAAAFALFWLMVALVRDNHLDRLLWILAGSTAAYAVLSIDAAAAGVLFHPFGGLMDLLGCEFLNLDTGFEEGTRIVGIFGNPNALGGVLAMGVFLSLYLCRRAGTARSRAAACVVVAFNALGFFLAFSMGAVLFFVVAALCFLAVADRIQRAAYFVLMLQTAVVTVLCAMLAYGGLGRSGAGAAPVYLSMVLSAALIWVIERFVDAPLAAFLNGHGKLTVGVVGGVVAMAIAYVVAGFLWTGAYTLAPGERLERAGRLSPGAYEMTAAGPADLMLHVSVQNNRDTMMHTDTAVYDGPAAGAAFTVPEDAAVVHFSFASQQGGELAQAAYTGADNGALKLDYKLLPKFVANRLQGLWANQNAVQRLVFWKDGMKLFAQSPIVGQGTSAYEGRLRTVQDFVYDTRYPHNHYVQVMAEMGVLGLASFVGMAVCAVLALRRMKGGERAQLRAPLAAAVTMMFGHAVVEATWSFGCYLAVAFGVLAVLTVAAAPEEREKGGKALRVLPAVAWGGVLVFFAAIGGYMYSDGAYSAILSGEKDQTPYTMTQLARVDVYQGILYKLDMASNAATSEVPEFYDLAGKYAAQVSKRHNSDFDLLLAENHYFPRGEWENGVAALRASAVESGSLSAGWQTAFDQLEAYADACPDSRWYAEQVVALYEEMERSNQERMEPVSLSEGNLTFVARMRALIQ